MVNVLFSNPFGAEIDYAEMSSTLQGLVDANSLTLIEAKTAISGDTSFTSVPDKKLYVLFFTLESATGTANITLQFNTGGTYSHTWINDTTPTRTGGASSLIIGVGKTIGMLMISSETANRTCVSGSCFGYNNDTPSLWLGGRWTETDAITTMALAASAGTLVGECALYYVTDVE